MNTRPTLGELDFPCSPRVPLFHGDIKRHILDDNTIVFYHVTPPFDESDKGDTRKVGFNFAAYEWCGCPADKVPVAGHYWGPEVSVEYFAYGEARFDGVRHLWFGHEDTENQGYHYYPHLGSMKLLMDWLQKMEQEHCWDAPK